MTPVHITSIGAWEPAGGDPARPTRLLSTIFVNSCPVHLEAILVHDVDDEQQVVDDDFGTTLDGAYLISGGCPFQTASITTDTDGHEPFTGEYVIVAVSHAS